MTREWERAIDAADVERLRSLLDDGADIDARDRHGRTGLMLAAVHGRAEVVELLVDRGAALDHTAKFNLSALMLAVVNGHVEIVRTLVQAGADTELRGSGAPGFHDKNARDLAVRGESVMGLVTTKRGRMQGAATTTMPRRIVEERQRRRRPLFVVTLWAQGGCARGPRWASSTIRSGIAFVGPPCPHAQLPSARPITLSPRTARGGARR